MASTINLETPDLAISAYQRADVLGGEEVLLSELVGRHGKPVVLNFWAALCPPCRAEMPDIQAVFEQRAEDVTIVGVDIGPQQFLGSREDGKELLTTLAISYPVGTTFDDNVVREFRVVGMPTTFFINADGSLLRAWSGLLNEAKLHEFIDDGVAAAQRARSMHARALAAFPGGFGTFDELFELLTLIQTGKVAPIPVLLFGREFWERVVNFDALVEEGVVSERDLGIFRYVDSAAEGWAVVQEFYRERDEKAAR